MIINEVKNLIFDQIQGEKGASYSALSYDSRKVKVGDLFVCMKGEKFDSHSVISQVVRDGAKGIIIDHDCDYPEGVNVYKVKDSREALAYLSAAMFDYPADKLTTIAVTGTKGKTTTAWMLRHLLNKAGFKTGYMGTIGIAFDDVSVPLLNTTPESYTIHSTFNDMVKSGCKYVVMEVSSQATKMHRTDGIVFDYGIFTNISNDHIGPNEHKDFDEYIACKTRVMDQSKKIIVNADDTHKCWITEHTVCKDISYFGHSDKADYRVSQVRYVSEKDFIGLEFDAIIRGRSIKCDIGIPGEFNADNALAAIAIADMMGVNDDILSKGLSDIRVNGRMETVYSDDDIKVIVDFAHNEMSTIALLDTLRHYNPKRLVVVFGCGGNRSKERRYGMGKVAGTKADFSIITEDNNRDESIEDIIKDIHVEFDRTGGKGIDIPIREDAVMYAIKNHESGDIIAIIGKGHEDYIEKEGRRFHYTDQETVAKAVKELGYVQ